MHTARLRVELADLEAMQSVVGALAPEIDDGPPGTSTSLTCSGNTIHVDVGADDVSGLRAAINNVMRLLDAAQRAIESTG